jgi:hypothetical protein
MKRIIKELLFNGGDRSIKAKFNLSHIDERQPNEIIGVTALGLL